MKNMNFAQQSQYMYISDIVVNNITVVMNDFIKRVDCIVLISRSAKNGFLLRLSERFCFLQESQQEAKAHRQTGQEAIYHVQQSQQEAKYCFKSLGRGQI